MKSNDELALEINAAHAKVEENRREARVHRNRLGEILRDLKRTMPAEAFYRQAKAQLGMERQEVNVYLRGWPGDR
jgi:hypothetical protein